jgi:hypothetical protein
MLTTLLLTTFLSFGEFSFYEADYITKFISPLGAVSALEAGCRWADGVPEYSIPERNNKKITGKVTEDQCKAACEGETDFTCRSIDYAEGLCYLSEDDTYTAKITRGNVQFTYFEIVCEKGELHTKTYR